MMRSGHQAMSVPLAETTAWVAIAFTDTPLWVALGMALLVWHSCDWPDLDSPTASINNDLDWVTRAIGRIVRSVSWRVWRITRTALDKPKKWGDCHRDFTHSIEGCLVFGGTVAIATYYLPGLGTYCWYWGLAVFIGCLSHLIADSLTPSGVPWSIVVNRVVCGRTWQRHQAGKRGWFSTNTGGERRMVFLCLWPLSLLLALVFTGTLLPLIHIFIGG